MARSLLEKKKFVLTGPTGKLGRNLLPMLDTIGELITLERGDLNPKYIRSLIKKLGENTYFIHLAWPVSNIDYMESEENVDFFKISCEIFSSISDLEVKVISAGTIFEAGNEAIISDFIEPNPQNLYAEMKVKLHQHLVATLPYSHIWARIGYQISAFDPSHKLIPVLIKNQGKPILLNNGNNCLDFIHISDVALAFTKIINEYASFPKEIVIGTGRGIVVNTLAKYFSVDTKLNIVEGAKMSSVTNPQALLKSGWKPKYLSEVDLHTAIMTELRQNVDE